MIAKFKMIKDLARVKTRFCFGKSKLTFGIYGVP